MSFLGGRFIVLTIFLLNVQRLLSDYSTNFSSFDSNNWVLADNCEHCSNHNGDECTQMTPDAITFNTPVNSGAIITTSVLPQPGQCTNTNAQSLCKSGHMLFIPQILYGTIIVKALWFPGNASQVNTSTGFIGLDSDGNVASIVFGFHGIGWIGYNDEDFSHEFQTDIYKNSSDGHNQIYIKTPNTNLATFNTYELVWTPKQVLWKLNGEIKRSVNDTSIIPNIEMQARLHSRSGYCNDMPINDTFYSQFIYFEYIPYQQ